MIGQMTPSEIRAEIQKALEQSGVDLSDLLKRQLPQLKSQRAKETDRETLELLRAFLESARTTLATTDKA